MVSRPLLVFLMYSVVISFCYFLFISSLKQNVIPIEREEKSIITFLFPQGWGFFTKNPREPKYHLYEVLENGIKQVDYSITSSENFYGFSRRGNRISIELSRIMSVLPESSKWTNSIKTESEFLNDSISFSPINISSIADTIIYIKPGKYLMKEYQITPWNWLNKPKNYKPRYKYYALELQ